MARVKLSVNLSDAFKFYKNKKKEKGEKPVNERTFRDVCCSYNKKLANRVLAGFHTQLPYHMGFIRIVGRQGNIDRLSIDFKATKELGETIYHDNRHTDGKYFFWDWRKPNHLVKNMQYYTFLPTSGKKGNSLKEKLNAVLNTSRGYKRYMIVK